MNCLRPSSTPSNISPSWQAKMWQKRRMISISSGPMSYCAERTRSTQTITIHPMQMASRGDGNLINISWVSVSAYLANCRGPRQQTKYFIGCPSLSLTTAKVNRTTSCQNWLLQEFLHRIHWRLCRTPNLSILPRTSVQQGWHHQTNVRFNSHYSSPSLTICALIETCHEWQAWSQRGPWRQKGAKRGDQRGFMIGGILISRDCCF